MVSIRELLMTQVLLTSEDQAFIWATRREPVFQDRALQGNRNVTIYSKQYTSVDPLAGTSTEAWVITHVDVPIAMAHYPELVVANAAGLIQAGDQEMRFFDIGLLDIKTTVLRVENTYWRIIGQEHESFNGLSTLQVRVATQAEDLP